MSKKAVILTRKGALVQGALVPYLVPKLGPKIALDSAIDWAPILAPVTAKNFKERKPAIVAALRKQLAGKLAKDASIEDVTCLLDALDDSEPPEMGTMDALETDPNSGMPMQAKRDTGETMDEEPDDKRKKLHEFLEGKGMSAEDIAACDDMLDDPADGKKPNPKEGEDEEMDDEEKKGAKDMKGAKDEPPDFKGKPKVGGGMDKKAMDAAIQTAVQNERKVASEKREAERFVRPWVGELAMDHATAEEVYQTTLVGLGVDVEGVHPSAFRRLIEAQPIPGAAPARKQSRFAMDAAGSKSFAERFPDTQRIKHVN